MKKSDILGEMPFAVIKKKKRISVIKVRPHPFLIGIFGQAIERKASSAEAVHVPEDF